MAAFNPVTLKEAAVIFDVFIFRPFWYTSYPATPILSVEAVQLSVKDACVIEDAKRPVGAEGACESGMDVLNCTPGITSLGALVF